MVSCVASLYLVPFLRYDETDELAYRWRTWFSPRDVKCYAVCGIPINDKPSVRSSAGVDCDHIALMSKTPQDRTKERPRPIEDQQKDPIRAFNWCQNQRLWMTLKGHYASCFKTQTSFRAHQENLNEIDIHFRRRSCSPMTLVSGL